MRISDWSSVVCSSDLIEDMGRGGDPDSALRRMSADHLQDTLRNVIEWDTKRLDVEGQRLDTLKEIAATQEAYDARHLKVDRKSTRLNSSPSCASRMPSSA